jgi:hypothetical protein
VEALASRLDLELRETRSEEADTKMNNKLRDQDTTLVSKRVQQDNQQEEVVDIKAVSKTHTELRLEQKVIGIIEDQTQR